MRVTSNLLDRLTLPFVLVVVAAEFASFAATLCWATVPLPGTIGLAVDLVAPALFLHVFLAYPRGRLAGRRDRVLVVSAYTVTVGLALVRMLLGDFDDRKRVAVAARRPAAEVVRVTQLSLLALLAAAGLITLAVRWRGAARSTTAGGVRAGAARLALENERLQGEVRAGLVQVASSRARLVQASDRERRRLERNLHDGAQQRLLELAVTLRLLESRVQDDAESRELMLTGKEQLADSLEELRELAQGLHPAVLTDHGLAIALAAVAARTPVPVSLDVVDERLPEPVEVAAYYLICEALANVSKHARAVTATVSVAREGPIATVEVVDDGVGGADTSRGAGLRGLADRVEAVSGRLTIDSPRGGGTRIRAELPCA